MLFFVLRLYFSLVFKYSWNTGDNVRKPLYIFSAYLFLVSFFSFSFSSHNEPKFPEHFDFLCQHFLKSLYLFIFILYYLFCLFILYNLYYILYLYLVIYLSCSEFLNTLAPSFLFMFLGSGSSFLKQPLLPTAVKIGDWWLAYNPKTYDVFENQR